MTKLQRHETIFTIYGTLFFLVPQSLFCPSKRFLENLLGFLLSNSRRIMVSPIASTTSAVSMVSLVDAPSLSSLLPSNGGEDRTRSVLFLVILLAFAVQHLHKEAIKGDIAAQMLVVKVFFCPLTYLPDLGQKSDELVEFVADFRVSRERVVQQSGANLFLTIIDDMLVLQSRQIGCKGEKTEEQKTKRLNKITVFG